MEKKRIAIVTYGCQMNVRDSEVIAGLLTTNDYTLTTKPDEADVIIFNTCSVRQHAEEKVWSEIGTFVHKKREGKRGQSPKSGDSPRFSGKKKIIGVVGCMAQNYKEKIFERAPNVDFAVGPQDLDKIPGIIRKLFAIQRGQSPKKGDSPLLELKIWETDGALRPEEIYHTGFYADKEHAYVVISEGCSNFCSYCVVPYVRGGLRHRYYKDIIKEIEAAVDKGITKITLLGQNVNAYKSEVKRGQPPQNGGSPHFVDLIEMVNQVKRLQEFSFITSHPKDTTPALFKAMARLDKLKKHLHLPVQSGSNKILKLMNRGYTREFYLGLAREYRAIVPGAVLTTDIIVGFPQETEGDFQDTVRLLQEIKFNAAYIFKYSPRDSTEAASMPDDVPKQEKERRHKSILDLQKEISKGLKRK